MSGGSLRIGCVPYLNARPLLEGLEFPIKEMVPSRLFDAYQEGEFDVALLSSIDVISQSNPEIVDGVAIASRGDVYSVILAYSGELSALKKVRLDLSSHTSNALVRIVLEEFHGIHPEYVLISEEESKISPFDLPSLLIGDPAISFRKQEFDSSLRILDLGAEWFHNTGTPFVFALWSFNNDYTKKEELSERLRLSKELGLSQRSNIASRHPDPPFAFAYLTKCIHYDLGDEEKIGLNLFEKLLKKYGIIPNAGCETVYY